MHISNIIIAHFTWNTIKKAAIMSIPDITTAYQPTITHYNLARINPVFTSAFIVYFGITSNIEFSKKPSPSQ